MPTSQRDAQLLAAALLVFAAGVTLIALGVILNPPMALLRHLHH